MLSILKMVKQTPSLLQSNEAINQRYEQIQEKLKLKEVEFIPAEMYEPTKELNLTFPSGKWRPNFMPQVTIQHSLKHTIPLIIGLSVHQRTNLIQ